MAILNNNPLVGASGNQGGYNINNSLRFRSSASAYLNRTFASAGSRTTFTISVWIKRGTLSTEQAIITQGSGNRDIIRINPDNTLFFYWFDATYYAVSTTQVFRDPSAWYHIVVAIDTTQATASNRVKLYVNGSQITALANAIYPNQNFNFTYWGTTNPIAIGKDIVANNAHLDGYMAEFNFIDGSAKTPSDFGETDSTTGVWKPKAYTGTYGTNGFYLKFSDIATTSGSNAGLGKDFSGNSNYWTTNNISVTSGTTYDAMTDSPTLTSATVANYPVYDQLIPANVSGSGVRSISAANLYVTNSGPNGWSAIGTTMVMTSGSGKWYWEVTCSGTTSNGTMIGIHRPFTSTSTFPSAIIGYDTPPDPDGYGYYMGGNKYNNSGAGVAYGASYTAGDVIGVALDMSTAGSASITFYKNNTSQGVAFSSLTGDFFAAVSQAQANGLDINFGQRPFTYTPPTGYVALNTYNLPAPTILQGNKYMDATLYTGNGGTQSITNAAGFRPDFVWIKDRTTAYPNMLFDSVRGASKRLISNTTDSEATETDTQTSFNSNGFSVSTNLVVNRTPDAFVGWQWQAGQGSTSSNTSGTITSTVSVNTTAGFSVVTYTGNGSASQSIGHGLGVAPKWIIVKARSNGVYSWGVYHVTQGNTKYALLNTTDAFATSAQIWASTTPTSSVFYVGSDLGTNKSGDTYVAYCWAEIVGFSKFTSYTGNGSTDGPFIATNFAPKYVMIKQTNTTGDWQIFDTSRSPTNVASNTLYANGSFAEDSNVTNRSVDFLSNGFKIRSSGTFINASGGTYIFMAFASNPFKNSLAR